MSYERIRYSTLPRAVSDVVGDLADLFQKEMKLARAEISDNVSRKIQAVVWMIAAGAIFLVAILFALQSAVFWIATMGPSLAASSAIVAIVLAIAAAGVFFKGRSDAQADLAPRRTVHQIKQDIRVAKEELS